MASQDNAQPPDPFGDLAAAAVSLHEMYRSYVAAGFTDAQAFELVRSMLVAKLGGRSA